MDCNSHRNKLRRAPFTARWRACSEPNNLAIVWPNPYTTPQNINTAIRRVFIFWWEWVDSNHLRLKPTDLQSAPALQLRRTPNLVKNCQKSEDATILMQASVQNVHDRNQNQADSIFHNFLVRAAGIEPAFQAWKACILAFVLCPQQIQSHVII